MKNVLAILFLISLFFVSIPQIGCCGEHQEASPVACHHNCSLVCHNHLNADVIAHISIQEDFAVLASENISTFSYQNPTITRLKRPPIQSF